ncbi:MAG: FoF1 ATP synthase subunit a [Chloroflexota bacterium]|nr:FoF1 ATP synthase subunit a [Chloroflexota bacterium]
MGTIRSCWARLGRRNKILIITVVAIALMAVGRFCFPAPLPHVELPAEVIIPFAGAGITNTMLAALVTIIVAGLVCYFATRKMSLVPRGLQNLVEALLEMLINFINDTAGKEYGRKFFPMVATIFIFVLFNAWLSLIPGFITIGFWHHAEGGHAVIVPFLRGANTDLNFPLALALVSFFFVEYWGFKANGFASYVKRFISVEGMFKGLGQIFRGRVKSGVGTFFNGVISAFAGLVEIISELVRILSLSFRLFGNMTAGEILVLMMVFLIPWVVPTIFYGLELFLGFVQALIFGGLTLVFLVIAVSPREAH